MRRPIPRFLKQGSRLPFDDGHGVFGFGLAGGSDDAWRWFVQHDKAFIGDARGDAWSAGLRFGF